MAAEQVARPDNLSLFFLFCEHTCLQKPRLAELIYRTKLCLVENFKLWFLQHRGYRNKMECLNLKITDPESSKTLGRINAKKKKSLHLHIS